MKNEKVKFVIKVLLYIIIKLVKFIYNVFAFFGGFWIVLLFLRLGDAPGEMIAVSDLLYSFEMLMLFSVDMVVLVTVVNKVINIVRREIWEELDEAKQSK